MTRSLVLILALSTVAVAQGYPPSTIPTQASMSCGNGVVIRADGSVMVDEWRGYDSTQAGNLQRSFPTSVSLGKTLKDTTNICIEFSNGTLCADLGKLRGLIEANFPMKQKAVK